MQRMGKCMQEKTLRTLYLHLVPLIDRYLVVKFKILSKTPRRSLFFFRSKKSVSVARRYTTGERAFLTSGATRGRARNNRHFAYHENRASGPEVNGARITRIFP